MTPAACMGLAQFEASKDCFLIVDFQNYFWIFVYMYQLYCYVLVLVVHTIVLCRSNMHGMDLIW